jgi:hypothetical protein
MNAASRKPDPGSLASTLRAVGIAAAVALAMPLHAQECSGGSAGGTDATGNQCTAPADVVAPASTAAPAGSAPAKPAAATTAAGSAPPVKAAAHRKKVFDERRARFEEPGHPRIAAAPAPAASSTRSAP